MQSVTKTCVLLINDTFPYSFFSCTCFGGSGKYPPTRLGAVSRLHVLSSQHVEWGRTSFYVHPDILDGFDRILQPLPSSKTRNKTRCSRMIIPPNFCNRSEITKPTGIGAILIVSDPPSNTPRNVGIGWLEKITGLNFFPNLKLIHIDKGYLFWGVKNKYFWTSQYSFMTGKMNRN